MLSACVHRLKTQSASHGSRSLSAAAPKPLASSRARVQMALPSTSRLSASSLSCTRTTTSTVSSSLSHSRFYAKKAPKAQPIDEFDDSELDAMYEDDEPESETNSLDSFFGDSQNVGETRIFTHPRTAKQQSEPGRLEEDSTTEFEEQHKLEQELRQQYGASEAEFEMAMGMSTYRPMDRKGSHKLAKTVAMNKLAAEGNLSFADLADLDYDSLKEFAKEHEVNIEDFFTRTRTADGELSEFSIGVSSAGDEEVFEDSSSEGLVEYSREYLRTRRDSPKNFRDRIRVRCQAGGGGKGGVSFYRDTRVHRGPPDGGDGGDGGSVIFIAAENKKPSLASLNPSYRAGSGLPGSRTRRKGKSGNDIVIEVPLGTTITEFRSKQQSTQDELAEPNFVPEEQESAQPSQAEIFMNPGLVSQEELDEAAAESAIYQKALHTDPSTIQDPEERLQLIENRHRAKFMDPRTGRPWAPPELDASHPMAESASEFHRIISGYNSSQSPSDADFSSEHAVEGSAGRGGGAKASTSFASSSTGAPEPYFSFDGAPMPGKKGKGGKKNPIYISNSDWNEMESMEEELGLGEESDHVFGSDLVEKYRLKSPSEQPVQQANLPRTVELDEAGAYFIAAKGGAGGLGNFRLGAVRNRPQAVGTPGKTGESLIYQLELKLIADVGLVGFPNAGKSTFLSSVSRANPKIASYPFTTLSPEIGTVKMEDETQFTIADLPGLIEGAHANRGLGHQFLKHIERTSVLVYVIDMAGGDKRDPWKSFLTLWDELERYQPTLVRKPSIIVANKMDSGTVAHENLAAFSKKLKADKHYKGLKIYPASASSKMNTISVVTALRRMLGYPDMNTRQVRGKAALQKARRSGIVTTDLGGSLGDAMRNIR